MGQAIDSRQFRDALGQFATGVTIVTTVDETSEWIGLTANSFNSASMDPPLVLWSLAKSSTKKQAFIDGEYFAVNILAADQAQLSERFASTVDDRFAGLECETGTGGVPLLPGCSARFQCKMNYCYEGGDHLIFVGEVIEFDNFERPSLLFHQGQYAVSQPRKRPEDESSSRGGYSEDFLLPLLSRAFRHFSRAFYEKLPDAGISLDDWRVLATLSDRSCPIIELSRTIPMDLEQLLPALQRLEDQRLVQIDGDSNDPAKNASCTAAGNSRIIKLLAAAKAYEADALVEFPTEEQLALKQLLRRIIRQFESSR